MKQIINNLEEEAKKWREDPIRVAMANAINKQVILYNPEKGYENSRFILEMQIKRTAELLSDYLFKKYPNLHHQQMITTCSSL